MKLSLEQEYAEVKEMLASLAPLGRENSIVYRLRQKDWTVPLCIAGIILCAMPLLLNVAISSDFVKGVTLQYGPDGSKNECDSLPGGIGMAFGVIFWCIGGVGLIIVTLAFLCADAESGYKITAKRIFYLYAANFCHILFFAIRWPPVTSFLGLYCMVPLIFKLCTRNNPKE